jgi:hypothetical protein
MPTAHSPIDLGSLQKTLHSARATHKANSRTLTKAQDAFKRSKALLEASTAALEDAARNVLANG